jgi:hypothetical protein
MAETETQEAGAVEGAEGTGQTEIQQGAEVPPEVKAALRKANKEAETLRLKLKEFEDRDKTETQKLTERAEAAEKAAADLASTHMRSEVALEKGLTAKQAKRLVGSTREELEADADDLLADLKPGRPKGDLEQGHRQQATGQSPGEAFAAILQGK